MKFKIKSGYVLKEIADSFLVVAVGKRAKEFNGVIKLNGTSAFLFNILTKGATIDQLVQSLMNEYEVEESTAREDVTNTIKRFKEAGLTE